jgi:hypothetical protein
VLPLIQVLHDHASQSPVPLLNHYQRVIGRFETAFPDVAAFFRSVPCEKGTGTPLETVLPMTKRLVKRRVSDGSALEAAKKSTVAENGTSKNENGTPKNENGAVDGTFKSKNGNSAMVCKEGVVDGMNENTVSNTVTAKLKSEGMSDDTALVLPKKKKKRVMVETKHGLWTVQEHTSTTSTTNNKLPPTKTLEPDTTKPVLKPKRSKKDTKKPIDATEKKSVTWAEKNRVMWFKKFHPPKQVNPALRLQQQKEKGQRYRLESDGSSVSVSTSVMAIGRPKAADFM